MQLLDTHDEPTEYFLSGNWTGEGRGAANEAARKAAEAASTRGAEAARDAADQARREAKRAADPARPTVFVGRPARHHLCPICADVFNEPVVSDDGVTYCRTCVPLVGGAESGGALGQAPDESLLGAVRHLPIACRHALVRRKGGDSGVTAWRYDHSGCQQTLTVASRLEHEASCHFAFAPCGLPFSDSPMDNCAHVARKVALEQHRRTCSHRLVDCTYKGCGRRVQARKLADHQNVCWHKPLECPNAPCMWRGTRRELGAHMDVCPEAEVVCGREDTERPSECCKHGCRRRMLEFHRTQCDYRPVACQYCKTHVSYLRLRQHEETCEYRKVLCEDCGQMVPHRRFAEHTRLNCAAASRRCEFADYGCTDRCAPGELASHLIENAHAHLRLVMLQLERVKGDMTSWSEDVTGVRQAVIASVQRSAEELDQVREQVNKMRADGEAETLELRRRVDTLQRLYEETERGFRRQLVEVDEEVRQRTTLIADENRALREVLAGCLTHDQLREVLREVEAGRVNAKEQVEAVRAQVERHSLAWEADAGALNALARDTAREGAVAAKGLREQCVDLAVANKERWGALWGEMRAVGRAYAAEATACHARGAVLEGRLERLNENNNPHLLVRSNGSGGAQQAQRDAASRKLGSEHGGAARGDRADSARGGGVGSDVRGGAGGAGGGETNAMAFLQAGALGGARRGGGSGGGSRQMSARAEGGTAASAASAVSFRPARRRAWA